jgi:hypothetical protein
MTEYLSLDYASNVRQLKAKGYEYLTFYAEREVSCDELKDEPGYEQMRFREAIPSVKPRKDDGISVTCVPIESEECVIILDSDSYSYQVDARYFQAGL